MTENKTVLAWLEEMKAMCQPDNVVWIDGSEEQLEALRAEAVKTGEMIKLNQQKKKQVQSITGWLLTKCMQS